MKRRNIKSNFHLNFPFVKCVSIFNLHFKSIVSGIYDCARFIEFSHIYLKLKALESSTNRSPIVNVRSAELFSFITEIKKIEGENERWKKNLFVHASER